MSVQAKLEVVRRKHIVHLTGFGAYSLPALTMPSKVWDKFTYPFLNFNGCTVEV